MFPTLSLRNAFPYDILSEIPLSLSHATFCSDDRPCMSLPFVSLSILWFLVLAVLRLYFYSSRRSHVVQNARGVLQAMLPILTPTSSAWPAPYPSLAYCAAIRKTRQRTTLQIPLQTLYFDILHGRIELRNPKDHLPALFRDSLSHSSSELSVSLDVGFYWWTKLLAWMIFCDTFAIRKIHRLPVSSQRSVCFSLQDQSIPYSQALLKESYYMPGEPPKNSLKSLLVGPDAVAAQIKIGHSTSPLNPPSLLFLNTLHEETPAVSLDCIPHRHLERCIRSLQTSLTSGSFLMLGITLRAGNADRSFWSKATVLTALPFLPRRLLRHHTQQERLVQRTTTPLLASVLSVLQLLTSGPEPLTVEVARNVSREYANFLHETVDELENDCSVRAAFVREWGRQGWIEETLCMTWEAALVDAGMLENWVIVVCKQR